MSLVNENKATVHIVVKIIFCHDSVFCDRNDKFNASFFVTVSDSKTNEPPHDKTNSDICIQRRLGSAWASESLLGAQVILSCYGSVSM